MFLNSLLYMDTPSLTDQQGLTYISTVQPQVAIKRI